MKNRVNYLAKEEQKYLKKILISRDEADKKQMIKHDKIQSLQERIVIEKKNQDEINSKIDSKVQAREKSQAKRLKNAYERMLAFERDR